MKWAEYISLKIHRPKVNIWAGIIYIVNNQIYIQINKQNIKLKISLKEPKSLGLYRVAISVAPYCTVILAKIQARRRAGSKLRQSQSYFHSWAVGHCVDEDSVFVNCLNKCSFNDS